MRSLIAITVSLLPLMAFAAQIDIQQNAVSLSGPILIGDFDKFSLAIAQQKLLGNEVSTVTLNSPGGYIADGGLIAASVRELKLQTLVRSDAYCASACFTIFLGGHKRTFEPGAHIGVHRGKSLDTGEDNWIGTHLMTRLNESLGAPLSVLEKAETTPSSEIAWLSDDDLSPITSEDAPSLPPGTVMKSVVDLIKRYGAEISRTAPGQPPTALVAPAAPVPVAPGTCQRL